MYSTEIVADSLAPCGTRLTTWELCYPRFVHAELMTHRVFSRNSASSRAIPVQKMMDRIKNDPVLPKWWGKNQAGMQARAELEGADLEAAKKLWLELRDQALEGVKKLGDIGLHKQIANRPLESWMFITVIVSATSFANWFKLRDHVDAQPEIGWLAGDMRQKYKASKPVILKPGEWHMPYTADRLELSEAGYGIEAMKKISTGRLARVSFLTHNGVRDPAADLELCDRLSTSGHWSPFEHVAQAFTTFSWNEMVSEELHKSFSTGKPFNQMILGNFVGWKQFRKEFSGEHGFDFDEAA